MQANIIVIAQDTKISFDKQALMFLIYSIIFVET